MSKRSNHYIISILALLWFVFVVVFYFVTHKPITSDQALNLAKTAFRLAIIVSTTAIAGGIGLRILPFADNGTLINFSLQCAFGFGVVSIAVLIIGSIIGINSIYSWLGVFLSMIIFRREILRWIRSWSELPNIWIASHGFGKLIGFGTLIILFSTLVTAFAPALKFDSLVYHLTLPQTYLTHGRFGYIPENMFWGMPQLGEMLYTWVIALGGIQTATMLGWMFGVLALVGLFGYTDQRFGSETAWVAIASLLAGFTLADSLAWGYVDWLSLLFGLAVFVCLDRWRHEGDAKELIIAGLFSGLALGVKYTAGVLVLAGIGIILYQCATKRDNRKRKLTYLLVYITPAILISLPGWIKNIEGTGNPFYPFLISAGAMDQFRIQFYVIPSWGNWQDILLLPLRATIVGVEGALGYSASIGPLLLALSPLAFLGWSKFSEEKRTSVTTAALIAGVMLIVWVIAGRLSAYLIQSRLYSSIFPMVAFLAGVGFNSISQVTWSGIRFRNVFGVLLLLVYGLIVFEVSVNTINRGAMEVVLGLEKEEDYLGNNLGWYEPAMKAVRELPEGSEVLMLWEPRSLYCFPKCIPDEIIDRWAHDLYMYGEPTSILRSWKEAGYTHLLYYKTGAEFIQKEDARYSNSDWEALERLLAGLPLLEDLGGAYLLYDLK